MMPVCPAVFRDLLYLRTWHKPGRRTRGTMPPCLAQTSLHIWFAILTMITCSSCGRSSLCTVTFQWDCRDVWCWQEAQKWFSGILRWEQGRMTFLQTSRQTSKPRLLGCCKRRWASSWTAPPQLSLLYTSSTSLWSTYAWKTHCPRRTAIPGQWSSMIMKRRQSTLFLQVREYHACDIYV